MNNKIYFRRKTKKPYSDTGNSGHGNRGYIKFEEFLLSTVENKSYSGYVIVIWDGKSWYDENKGSKPLLTIDEAKNFLQKEYGGTWRFSEKDITI